MEGQINSAHAEEKRMARRGAEMAEDRRMARRGAEMAEEKRKWHAEGQRWQRRKGNGTQRGRDGRGET